MRVRELKSNDSVKYDNTPTSLVFGEPEESSKFNWVLERRLEQLWLRSEKIGWDYGEFVTRLIEVLIVLRQRNRAG
jgi:hypothetical protein